VTASLHNSQYHSVYAVCVYEYSYKPLAMGMDKTEWTTLVYQVVGLSLML